MNAINAFKSFRKGLTLATAGSVLGSLAFVAGVAPSAAAFSATSITGTGITANSAAISAAVTPSINFTPTTAISAGNTISISFNGLSTTAILAQADITASGGCTGTVTMVSIPSATNNPVLAISGLTCTATTPATLAIAAARLSTSGTAANYSILISSPADSGGFFFYVGNENQVQVRAFVSPTMTFIIDNAADTAPLPNVGGGAVGPRLCDMGNVSTIAGTCQYRTHIAVNASNGYTVTLQAGGPLTNGTYNFNNVGGAGVAAIGGSGTAISGAAENYGLQLTEGASTTAGGVITRGGTFGAPSTNYYPVPVSTTTLYSTTKPNNPTSTDLVNTALITLSAIAAGGTGTGQFTQLITHTVNPSF